MTDHEHDFLDTKCRYVRLARSLIQLGDPNPVEEKYKPRHACSRFEVALTRESCSMNDVVQHNRLCWTVRAVANSGNVLYSIRHEVVVDEH